MDDLSQQPQEQTMVNLEAEQRVLRAADQLMDMIGCTDLPTREYLASQCMLLLMRRFHITPPREENSESN